MSLIPIEYPENVSSLFLSLKPIAEFDYLSEFEDDTTKKWFRFQSEENEQIAIEKAGFSQK